MNPKERLVHEYAQKFNKDFFKSKRSYSKVQISDIPISISIIDVDINRRDIYFSRRDLWKSCDNQFIEWALLHEICHNVVNTILWKSEFLQEFIKGQREFHNSFDSDWCFMACGIMGLRNYNLLEIITITLLWAKSIGLYNRYNVRTLHPLELLNKEEKENPFRSQLEFNFDEIKVDKVTEKWRDTIEGKIPSNS